MTGRENLPERQEYEALFPNIYQLYEVKMAQP